MYTLVNRLEMGVHTSNGRFFGISDKGVEIFFSVF